MTNIEANFLLTHTIHRSTFINILETAMRFGEHRFARRAALNWLTDYPGDLYVNFLNVKAFVAGKGNPDTALSNLHQLILKDPLFFEAYELAIEIAESNRLSVGESFRDGVFAAGGISDSERVSEWSKALRQARKSLQVNKLDEAEGLLLSVIAANPPTPLAAIAHIELLERQDASENLANQIVRQKIIEHYHQRWDTCLQIRLYYAINLMESNRPERGVELIHAVVVDDPAAQVINRLWGSNHPYRNLWPDNITRVMTDPLPASIAAWFGLNLITSNALDSPAGSKFQIPLKVVVGETEPEITGNLDLPRKNSDSEEWKNFASSETGNPRNNSKSQGEQADVLISTSETLDRIASRIQRTDITRSEGRFPVYVILTSQENLLKHYGQQGSKQVLTAVDGLNKAVNNKKNWSALTVPIDDPKSVANLNIKPVRASDPWAIKRALIDLDNNLSRKGEMIGALLIIGGPQIIPFHCLPNPIDDQDQEISSDNPYGTRDENYFAPEWPVGRIPGDATSDIQPLIKAINTAADSHKSQKKSPGWIRKFWTRIRNFLQPETRARNSSIGYTAAIWRRASEVVYQQMGDRKKLLISPPASTVEFRMHQSPSRFAYFNLHGILDSPDWYGHKDPSDTEPVPDYPVALQPGDIRGNNNSPLVIFSEACYGAHIDGRSFNQSIPLKFLEEGSIAYVGSTATAYGSVTAPLIAADLLGHQFWKYIDQGIPVGEALRRAKIELIRTMNERQGYLDGEDQKTLISFVLYGDPLLFPFGVQRLPKDIYRSLQQNDVPTVCDKNSEINLDNVPDETIANVKRIVRQYLPGMDGATIHMNKIHARCNGKDHNCPTTQLHINSKSVDTGNRQVFTMSKRVQTTTREFVQIARMTLDDRGHVIKLAISR